MSLLLVSCDDIFISNQTEVFINLETLRIKRITSSVETFRGIRTALDPALAESQPNFVTTT